MYPIHSCHECKNSAARNARHNEIRPGLNDNEINQSGNTKKTLELRESVLGSVSIYVEWPYPRVFTLM